MKIASYEQDSARSIGVVRGDTIIDAGFDGDMIELIARWDEHRPTFEAQGDNNAVPLADVRLAPPLARPGKIFAIGLNYADHIAESKMETPQRQVWFTKAQTSINGPFDPILIAKNTFTADYEVELVAVIGKRGKHIAAENAHGHVFGYCVGNDVTERMWQHAGPQWSLGKSFDTHAPIGPWITTADEIADPHALALRCFVNGEQRQSSNTGMMLHSIYEQIEYLSTAFTLEPGDLIATGTPEGVGIAKDPPVFLKVGDVVRCEIDGVGAIENPVIAEPG